MSEDGLQGLRCMWHSTTRNGLDDITKALRTFEFLPMIK